MMGDLIEIWQGGVLYYADDQLDAIREALVKFQQKNDTKAEVMVTLPYTSGQVCFVLIALLLVPTDIVNSFMLLSFIFMMLPLLSGRRHLMISWPFPQPREMSQQRHFTAYFKVRLLWLGQTVFGW